MGIHGDDVMKRFAFVAASMTLAVAVAARVLLAQSPTAIEVVKDPGCGCCTKWVQHLSKAGFKATVTESSTIDALKDSKGVPKTARSCHTATVGGYVIEGHVPADVIKRLLIERPNVVGLAVPGMPAGSPGMEVPDGRTQPYDVLAFDKAGKTSVFASRR
jgi:hypothetical protein